MYQSIEICVFRPGLQHGPWKMAILHGPTWWSNFHGTNYEEIILIIIKSIYKAFGPLTRCKPYGDQEELTMLPKSERVGDATVE